ncbi:MAG: NAD(+)/NADH kinase [Fusobacterium sp. JB021]|nr:NAD(+)/NADH kinase [Fusobacterium sp. JB020]MDP0494312.1 NAD(+)/NADH kinase [Fusobacterium sp. JB021]MDP0506319.1 NAD(+)/NADH kinase [Fusobacterium sp. JB019]
MEKKCVIFYNKEKIKAIEMYHKIIDFFQKNKVLILSPDDILEADFAIVIGGDGTLLRASKQIILKKNLITIAINAGNLGFLTETKLDEGLDACKNFLEGKYKIEKRGILEITINSEKFYALNEVVFSNGGMGKRLTSLDLFCDIDRINRYKGDGVIIATPTGSTAYSLSAGGPILSHYLQAILITPIAPHNLTSRPIVIDSKRQVRVEHVKGYDRCFIIVDGEMVRQIEEDDKIEIKYSEKTLNLFSYENRNYYSVLKEKLRWGDNLC